MATVWSLQSEVRTLQVDVYYFQVRGGLCLQAACMHSDVMGVDRGSASVEPFSSGPTGSLWVDGWAHSGRWEVLPQEKTKKPALRCADVQTATHLSAHMRLSCVSFPPPLWSEWCSPTSVSVTLWVQSIGYVGHIQWQWQHTVDVDLSLYYGFKLSFNLLRYGSALQISSNRLLTS